MTDWYDIVHLDRLVVLTGSYDADDDVTRWTLPFIDNTLDTIVLGSGHGEASGSIFSPDNNNDGTVSLSGDYSAGEAAIGKSYPFTLELSRPYVPDRRGDADINAHLTVREVNPAYHQTGSLQVRGVQPNRDDQIAGFDIDPIADGVLQARVTGAAHTMRVFVDNLTPKPSTVSAIEWIVDYEPREGQ